MKSRYAAVLALLFAATSFSHATMTDTVGNGGIGGFLGNYFGFSGEHFHLACRDDEVLVGVYGLQGSWIDEIGIRCSRVDSQGRWLGAVAQRSSTGGDGSFLIQDIPPTDCPRNSAITGFRGNYGSYVNEVQFECKPLTDDEHTQSDNGDWIGPFGSKGGAGSEDSPLKSCNANRAATGIYGRSDSYVDSMGLKCAHEKIWKPEYHYFPKNSANNSSVWMNDPSGLIFKDGVYHLYYQAVSGKQRFKPNKVQWDHATSTDLLHWRDQPPVFSAMAGQIGERDGSPFTGSAVSVPRDELPDLTSVPGSDPRCIAAFFTRAVLPPPYVPRQRQNVAASCNGGRSFSADTHALSSPVGLPQLHFRDPKVFRFEDPSDSGNSAWIMVLAAGDFVEIYRATSLNGPWARSDRVRIFSGDNMFVETADLMRLPVTNVPGADGWVLTFAKGVIPWGSNDAMAGFLTQQEYSKSVYLIGRFDGHRFRAEGAPADDQRAGFRHFNIAGRFDSGPDFYASQSWHIDGKTSKDFAQQRTVIGAWLNNWRYALFSPTYEWQGQLSVPRELSLYRFPSGDMLIQKPVRETTWLRNPTVPRSRHITQQNIDGSGISIDMGDDKSYELILDIDVRNSSSVSVDINEGRYRGSITLVWRRTQGSTGRLFFDRGNSFPLSDAPDGFVTDPDDFGATVTLQNNRLNVDLYVDRNSVEAFYGLGEHTLSALYYPHPDNRTVRIRADGAPARIIAVKAIDLDKTNVAGNRQRIVASAVGQRRLGNRIALPASGKPATKSVNAPIKGQLDSQTGARADAQARARAKANADAQARARAKAKAAAQAKSKATAKSRARARARARAVVSSYLKRRRQSGEWLGTPAPIYKPTRSGWQVDVNVKTGKSRARMRYQLDSRWRVTRATRIAMPGTRK